MSKIKTIITGHGNFATGLAGAVELLAGNQSNYVFIDFSKEMSEEELGEKLESLVGKQTTLIFTDLIGGTPFKEATKIAFSKDNVRVVTGCNLASLLETIFRDYKTVDNYADDLVYITKQTVQVYKAVDEIEEDF
jgi:PTS system N-acetylgalactosamine-specific IIA component